MEKYQLEFRDYVTDQLISYRDRTAMWGPNIAVELKTLQLLEIEQIICNKERFDKNKGAVMQVYFAELKKLGKSSVTTLCAQLKEDEHFGTLLYMIADNIRKTFFNVSEVNDRSLSDYSGVDEFGGSDF